MQELASLSNRKTIKRKEKLTGLIDDIEEEKKAGGFEQVCYAHLSNASKKKNGGGTKEEEKQKDKTTNSGERVKNTEKSKKKKARPSCSLTHKHINQPSPL